MPKKPKKDGHKKEYTGADLMNETMKLLGDDSIAKKLPKDQLEMLTKILVKTVLKGDL